MEKSTPHHGLSAVRALAAAGRIRFTASALAGAAAIGMDPDGMIHVIATLTRSDFYKSMTTHGDHRIWQDVYRPRTTDGPVYVKLTVMLDVLVVSFKEL